MRAVGVHMGRASWCVDYCGKTDGVKLSMLKRAGFDCSPPPPNITLDKWLGQQVGAGTVVAAPPVPPEDVQLEEQREEAIEKERTELQNIAAELDLPDPATRVGNLWRHLRTIHAHYRATGEKFVSDAHYEVRLAQCEGCDKNKKDGDDWKCSICGCGLTKGIPLTGIDAKPRYIALHCEHPDGDCWAGVDARFNGQ